jgi:hypothetical protein
MKMNKFAMVSVAFILGAMSVISFLALVSFTGMSVPMAKSNEVSPILATDANTLLKEYLKTAGTPAKPINGVFLDKQELEAMNRLAGENPNLAGFRIYFGKETSGLLVGLVVGVDDNYSDLTANSIYKTDSPKTGPCPPVCDKNSTIIK